MATKVKRVNAKELQEEKELEEFIAARKESQKTIVKRVLIAVVCVALVLCFCLPSLGALISH